MKKLLFVSLAVAGLLFSGSTKAQAVPKIGYFDEQAVLSLFPGIQRIDTLMAIYQRDSLGVEYQYSFEDYKRRDSIFKKDSATMPAKARELAQNEIGQLVYKLQNWQQYSQQMGENKLESLLFPYKKQIFDALQDVIKDGKYTYVLNAQALALQYAQPPLLDNLSIRVAIKLRLPLGKDTEAAWKAAGGSLSPGTGAPASTAPKKP